MEGSSLKQTAVFVFVINEANHPLLLYSSTPHLLHLLLRLWKVLDRRIHLHKPSGQDGGCVQPCGGLLVTALLQSISQLIELLSITKEASFQVSFVKTAPFQMAAEHLIVFAINCSAKANVHFVPDKNHQRHGELSVAHVSRHSLFAL